MWGGIWRIGVRIMREPINSGATGLQNKEGQGCLATLCILYRRRPYNGHLLEHATHAYGAGNAELSNYAPVACTHVLYPFQQSQKGSPCTTIVVQCHMSWWQAPCTVRDTATKRLGQSGSCQPPIHPGQRRSCSRQLALWVRPCEQGTNSTAAASCKQHWAAVARGTSRCGCAR